MTTAGVVEIGGRSYYVDVTAWSDEERAWRNGGRVIEALTTRLSEIGVVIDQTLARELTHWENAPTENSEVVQAVLRSIQATSEPMISISDRTSCAYFDGPSFVEGHSIELQFDEEGNAVSAGLAG